MNEKNVKSYGNLLNKVNFSRKNSCITLIFLTLSSPEKYENYF